MSCRGTGRGGDIFWEPAGNGSQASKWYCYGGDSPFSSLGSQGVAPMKFQVLGCRELPKGLLKSKELK